jgi:hypothetical protein
MINEEIKQLTEKRNNIVYNNFSIGIKNIQLGIVFTYATWSPTIVQLRNLLKSLEQFPQTPVYLYNIDEPGFIHYADENKIESHGWGETFWVKGGEIIAAQKKYSSDSMNELIHNNTIISE